MSRWCFSCTLCMRWCWDCLLPQIWKVLMSQAKSVLPSLRQLSVGAHTQSCTFSPCWALVHPHLLCPFSLAIVSLTSLPNVELASSSFKSVRPRVNRRRRSVFWLECCTYFIFRSGRCESPAFFRSVIFDRKKK